jgi:hypothetical protein
LHPPRILEGSYHYVTKTFFIRFTEEECDFNELCVFRAEFDATDRIEPTFILEADLMYADMNKLVGPGV